MKEKRRYDKDQRQKRNGKKTYSTESIIEKLREAEVLISQGKTLSEVCRAFAINDQTYYRWQKEHGGIGTEQAKRMKELERENAQLSKVVADLTLDNSILKEILRGNSGPARRRETVEQVQVTLEVSERRACRAIEQARSTQRYQRVEQADEEQLTQEVVRLASKFRRYGYRRVTGLLRNHGWMVNHKQVERIWWQEGLIVPKKQPKRGRLWLNDGSCIRLRDEHPRQMCSYDFVADRTHNGKAFGTLNIIDQFIRECLAIRVDASLKTEDVQGCLTELFCSRGISVHLRSDNGSEFAYQQIRFWLSERVSRHWLLNQAVPGKTATSRVSTASFATNY